jgi:hypothetical protein
VVAALESSTEETVVVFGILGFQIFLTKSCDQKQRPIGANTMMIDITIHAGEALGSLL